eukprot:26276-Hanusia_phi.AAC.1
MEAGVAGESVHVPQGWVREYHGQFFQRSRSIRWGSLKWGRGLFPFWCLEIDRATRHAEKGAREGKLRRRRRNKEK